MGQYYAIVRSDNFLAHYGIKGMRWHVRKALQNGNTHKYDRYRKKAMKRLMRYEKQAANGSKYARRAVQKTASAIGVGGKVLMGISNPSVLVYKAGIAGYNAYRAANTNNAAKKAEQWRDEIKEDFGIDAVYEAQKKKSRRS